MRLKTSKPALGAITVCCPVTSSTQGLKIAQPVGLLIVDAISVPVVIQANFALVVNLHYLPPIAGMRPSSTFLACVLVPHKSLFTLFLPVRPIPVTGNGDPARRLGFAWSASGQVPERQEGNS